MSAPMRIQRLITAVAAQHGVTVADLLGKVRSKRLWDARAHAMAAVRALAMANGRPPSYERIGGWFNRHHATVISAVRRAQG